MRRNETEILSLKFKPEIFPKTTDVCLTISTTDRALSPLDYLTTFFYSLKEKTLRDFHPCCRHVKG